jgi:hypothetical protein
MQAIRSQKFENRQIFVDMGGTNQYNMDSELAALRL